MVAAAEMTARHAAQCARLAELGMAMAETLKTRTDIAETNAEVADLSRAFHAVGRTVRQSMALEARIHRDAQRQDQEDRKAAVRETAGRVDLRKARVKAAIERLVWTEYEPDEAEALIYDLDDRLDEAALYDTFLDEPVEAHIARLAHELGLPDPPLSGEGDREAVEGVAAAEVASGGPPDARGDYWRSSA